MDTLFGEKHWTWWVFGGCRTLQNAAAAPNAPIDRPEASSVESSDAEDFEGVPIVATLGVWKGYGKNGGKIKPIDGHCDGILGFRCLKKMSRFEDMKLSENRKFMLTVGLFSIGLVRWLFFKDNFLKNEFSVEKMLMGMLSIFTFIVYIAANLGI